MQAMALAKDVLLVATSELTAYILNAASDGEGGQGVVGSIPFKGDFTWGKEAGVGSASLHKHRRDTGSIQPRLVPAFSVGFASVSPSDQQRYYSHPHADIGPGTYGSLCKCWAAHSRGSSVPCLHCMPAWEEGFSATYLPTREEAPRAAVVPSAQTGPFVGHIAPRQRQRRAHKASAWLHPNFGPMQVLMANTSLSPGRGE